MFDKQFCNLLNRQVFLSFYEKNKNKPDIILDSLLQVRSIPSGFGDLPLFIEHIMLIIELEDFDFLRRIIIDERFTREGCWNDLNKIWNLKIPSSLRNEIITRFSTQIVKDVLTGKISNCAKWVPTEKSKKNTHGFVRFLSQRLGQEWKKHHMKNKVPFVLDGTKKSYRQLISYLREKLKVTERLMSLKRGNEIEVVTLGQLHKHRFYFKKFLIDNSEKTEL